MFQNLNFLFTLIVLELTKSQNKTFDLYVESVCKDTNLTYSNSKSFEEQNIELTKYFNPFASDLGFLINFLENNRNILKINSKTYPLIFSIAILLISIIYFFTLLFFYLFNKKFELNSQFIKNTLLFFTFLLGGIIIGATGLIYYFFYKLKPFVPNIICNLNMIPKDIMNGYTLNDSNFIGISHLNKTMSELFIIIDKLSTVQNNLNAIAALKIEDQRINFINSIYEVSNILRKYGSVDGLGASRTPHSIELLTPELTAEIGLEFRTLDSKIKSIIASVNLSINFLNDMNGIKNISQHVFTEMNLLTNLLIYYEDLLYIFSTILKNNMNLWGYIILIIIIVLIFAVILVLINNFLLHEQNIKKRLFFCVLKTMLLKLALISLLFSALSVILFLTAFFSGTVCKSIDTIFKIPSFSKFAVENNLEVNQTISQIMDVCLTSNGSGKIIEIFKKADISKIDVNGFSMFIDGFKTYKKEKKNIVALQASPASITNLFVHADKFKNYEIWDFDNIPTAIETLESYLDTSIYTKIKLGSRNCTGACLNLRNGIPFNSTNFINPYKPDAQKLWGILSSHDWWIYKISEVFRFFILGYYGNTSKRIPNVTYINTLASFKSSFNNLDLVLPNIEDVLSTLDPNKSIDSLFNCKVLTNSLFLLQDNLCLTPNELSAKIYVLITIISFLIVCFNWLACISFFCLNKKDIFIRVMPKKFKRVQSEEIIRLKLENNIY